MLVIKAFSSEIPSYNAVHVDLELTKAYSSYLNAFRKFNNNNNNPIPFIEFWDEEETQISYSHLIMSFCFLGIPFLKFFNAKYLVLGNEYDLNSKFVNKDKIRCYPSYDQSFEGTRRLNEMIGKVTGCNVTSIISPLYDLAAMKILHNRYSNLGKYQSSCAGLDAVNEKRWCYNCADDVRFFLYMKAIGQDPKKIGINRNMLDKKYIKYHTIFNPEKKGRYERGGDLQIKFAYYLAYRNKAKGYAIDLFKKKYLDEIKVKEDRLYKKYFSIHNSSLIPKEIRKEVISIYREELK